MDGWNDSELDIKLNQYNGPKDESNTQFIYRTYTSLCDRICKPNRKLYTTADLNSKTKQIMTISNQKEAYNDMMTSTTATQEQHKEEEYFSIFENDITIPNFEVNTIHSIFWLNNKVPLSSSTSSSLPDGKQYCLFYLHTNTRSAIEAIELLPICYEAGYHLFAIDLPGHGRTYTHNDLISTQLSLAAIDTHIGHLKLFYQISEVVLLGRGMATALAIEYCSLLNTNMTSRKSGASVSSGLIRSMSRGLLKPSVSRESMSELKGTDNSATNNNIDNYMLSEQLQSTSSSEEKNAEFYTKQWQQQYQHQQYQQKQDEKSSKQSSESTSTQESSSGINSIFSYFGFGSTTSTSSLSTNITATSATSVSNSKSNDNHNKKSNATNTLPSNPHTFQHIQTVTLLILDTPYTSVQALIEDAIERVQAQGYYVPKFLLGLGASLVHSSVTTRLGFDPYMIKPIELLSNINMPILILSALSDDYIPIHHAMEIHKQYRQSKDQRNGINIESCSIVLFEGSHNSIRPEPVHQAIKLFIERKTS